MKLLSKTGNILTSLIFLGFLVAAFLYWKTTSQEQSQVEKRGFLTYEEHLKKEEREKAFKEVQEKIKNFFENFRGRHQP